MYTYVMNQEIYILAAHPDGGRGGGRNM